VTYPAGRLYRQKGFFFLKEVITPVREQRLLTTGLVNDSLSVIGTVHNGPDGYVTFASRGARELGSPWQELGGVKVEDLRNMFPAIANWLVEDSYFSLSSFWHATPEFERLQNGRLIPYTHPLTDLPTTSRVTSNLRWLNTCFVDLDVRGGTDFAALMAGVIRAQDDEVIPPASMFSRSGRGMWAFWLLRDVYDPTIPQRAFPEKIRLFCEVQRAIGERLQRLGMPVDRACFDPTHMARVPGSVNSKAEARHRRVTWWIQRDSDGERYFYTLRELATAFGITPRKTSLVIDAPRGEFRERGRRGWRQRWANTIDDFKTVRAMRGGFKRGTRRNAVLLHAILLARNGVSRSDLEREVIKLGAECQPPLSVSQCRYKIRKAMELPAGFITYKTCMEWLKVTPGEAVFLSHWPMRPKLPKPRGRAQDRYLAILKIVNKNGGHAPSRAEMVKLLAPTHIVSPQQIGVDYAQLGLKSEKQPGRPKGSLSLVIGRPSLSNFVVQRRSRIEEIINQLGFVPSIRDMTVRLAAVGVVCSHMTVAGDYTALNLKRPPQDAQLSMTPQWVQPAFICSSHVTPLLGSGTVAQNPDVGALVRLGAAWASQSS
jgi:hypothetical protein